MPTYASLSIQTQRDFPNNARTQGWGWLVRAGYLTRENQFLPLGEAALTKLKALAREDSFFETLDLPLLRNADEVFFASSVAAHEVAHCAACGYAVRRADAQTRKTPFSQEAPLALEKVATPNANSIEALANFLNIPKEKTAKALMHTRLADGKLIFSVIRGDMQLSESKLKNLVGDARLATEEEIARVGAAAGYASPVGLKDALIVVDDLIPQSPNLAAGANESGFHLLHVNCGRDYAPDLVADLTLAGEGDACSVCGAALTISPADVLFSHGNFFFDKILFALAEIHRDEKGLTLPPAAAPFDVYLMHIAGKTLDTRAQAEALYQTLQSAGVSVLFDDRDERAGVKFNDADLIGCPLRVAVGERALQNGHVELKPRQEKENVVVALDDLTARLKAPLAR
ncbi:MAG: hypothetical protein LC099_11445 [Anaerolineales bacterium]|nr:hypothetical protein [Anaerolineales bacterium]